MPWHTLTTEAVAERLQVDPGTGLSSEEAARRLEEVGPNKLEEKQERPLWRRILSLLTEPMTLVLVAAAVVSAFVSGELKTPVAILVVVAFNTVLNLAQEKRAESSVAALRDLSVPHARVRRGGEMHEIESVALVPGDVVLIDAGDVVPVDGRLLEANGLECQESALTGESTPVQKDRAPLDDEDAQVGDRSCMVFMSTDVTRGTGTFIVTGTAMQTEIGRVAGLLEEAGDDKTPLQRRIGQLARLLSIVAGIVVLVVVVLGLIRGLSFSDVLLIGVSLAVATIPEGLAAVVAFTLAMGANRLAKRGAILKNLASVETLGSTSHIATDKTGTLTLNQMTGRSLVTLGHRYEVSGEGYDTEGEVRPDSDDAPDPRPAMLVMAVAGDAVIRDGGVVGDPTEGALVVLAAKIGIDAQEARSRWPRVAEVPFDSSRKYMATLHDLSRVEAADEGSAAEQAGLPGLDGGGGLLLFVKGAPDVLADRSTHLATAGGSESLDDKARERLLRTYEDLTDEGLRVMAVAYRQYADGELDAETAHDLKPEDFDQRVTDLTLLGLVGIVDPPRPEAAEAVSEAKQAGIAVHMITGDHVGTASAIARDLGIDGDSVVGTDLDDVGDDELAERAPKLGVLARVAPEHKIRPSSRRSASDGARGGHDRRRGQRRARAEAGRHRRRHGHHRDRGGQGGGRAWCSPTTTSPRSWPPSSEGRDDLRQHHQVRPVPARNRLGDSSSSSLRPASSDWPQARRSPRCRSCGST